MSKEEEFIKEIGQSWKDILDKGGITHEYLRGKLQEELDYNEPKKKKPTYKAMRIRQPARQDAHKLRGDYPAEKHEIDTNLNIEIINYADSDKKAKP